MASTITGTVGVLSVSGVTLTGANGELGEANLTFGKERGKFNPVGTNVSMHATGMKTVEGTLSKRWVAEADEVASGSASLYQQLVDDTANTEFDIVVNPTGGGSVTVTGCLAVNRNTRVAPGTETIIETLTITGTNWS